MLSKWLQYLFVSFVWGSTNPLLKRGCTGLDTIATTSRLKTAFLQLKWLLLTPSFTLPFLLNQTGSILYYLVVAGSDLSVAVPVINSLTLVFTALVGRLMGETRLSFRSYLGMGLVVLGVSISTM